MHSHHDAIVSYFYLPQGLAEDTADGCITAPRIEVQRRRVLWSERGIEDYSILVSSQLRHLRDTSETPGSILSVRHQCLYSYN